MDSTVYYGAMLLNQPFSITVDSPYNTYRYPGIPVGPICNPGLTSIRAVLHPEGIVRLAAAQVGEGEAASEFHALDRGFNEFVNSDQFKPIIPGSN